VIALLAGVVLALPYVLYAHRTRDRRRVFGIGLLIAAAIYIVFALSRGNLNALLVESIGVVLFGILAFLGVRYSAYFLALGWMAHIAWDLLLHPVNVSSYAPWWYPVACIGFDLAVAGGIVGLAAGSERERQSQ
jgi:hypothetical protein